MATGLSKTQEMTTAPTIIRSRETTKMAIQPGKMVAMAKAT